MGRKRSKKQNSETMKAEASGAISAKSSRSWFFSLLAVAIAAGGGWFMFMKEPAAAADMVVYKSPSCGCCGAWVDYLEQNGFRVQVENVGDMDAVKDRLGVPDHAASCHTAQMGDYVIEGHVPVEDIRRLMKEQPQVRGIAAPGMPMGSPGMEMPGEPADRYDVVTFTTGGKLQLFSRH
uniref:CopG family transcriptional regulator n=1 Tax=Magnetococcus massalia (strain MO-1) TaxID=451514 RepID=A0A1S7LHU0_MAGMO|nr:conserved protein of unknown function [Candidatus Magnetococcus massalia]